MRKKISISLATAFLMISGSAYADGNITGTVFNKTTSEPLDFATVVLVNSKTGAPLPIPQPMRTECLLSPMHLRENILSVSA